MGVNTGILSKSPAAFIPCPDKVAGFLVGDDGGVVDASNLAQDKPH